MRTSAIPRNESEPAPFWYESLLLSEAAKLRGVRKIDLDAAAKDLIALQRGLTGTRRMIGGRYMEEGPRLSSYLLFYWPVSYAQTRALLAMAGVAGAGGGRVLDLGSGPAPCALAAADHLSGRSPGSPPSRPQPGAGGEISVVACDPSALALESARRLCEEGGGYRFTGVPRWDAAAEDSLPEGPFDLIILGHLVNELWVGEERRIARRLALLDRCFERLTPGGVLLLLEPALLSTGREALELRDRVVESGRRVLAPCVRSGPCPALRAEGQTCHSDFPWVPPKTVRDLSARTGLDKGLIKTTGFVFGRGPARSWEEGIFRVVSDPMVNKAGRVRYLLCGEGGRFPLSAKRGEGFPAERTFFSLARSQLLRLRGAVPRETGQALGPDTEIQRLAVAPDPGR